MFSTWKQTNKQKYHQKPHKNLQFRWQLLDWVDGSCLKILVHINILNINVLCILLTVRNKPVIHLKGPVKLQRLIICIIGCYVTWFYFGWASFSCMETNISLELTW